MLAAVWSRLSAEVGRRVKIELMCCYHAGSHWGALLLVGVDSWGRGGGGGVGGGGIKSVKQSLLCLMGSGKDTNSYLQLDSKFFVNVMFGDSNDLLRCWCDFNWIALFLLSISFHPPPQTSSLSLRGILQLLRQDAANSPHRRRRPRFVRRAVRRMRRWGLIPRPPSRPSQTPSSSQQQADPAPSGQEPAHSTPTSSSSAVEAVNQPVPQKLGLLAQTEQQQQQQQQQQGAPPPLLPPPVASPPPPPYAPPAPPSTAPNTPPVAVPPSSPSLASIFHTLGLSISLFRASPSSSTNSMPLSASPSFSSSSCSSDDDVLLIPLSEDTTSEDDVPMLTWMTSPPTHPPSPLLYLLTD